MDATNDKSWQGVFQRVFDQYRALHVFIHFIKDEFNPDGPATKNKILNLSMLGKWHCLLDRLVNMWI